MVDNSAVNRPYQRGVITNWDGMEKICRKIFYDELKVAPEEHPVVMSEAVGNPRQNREMMTQMLFETFNSPAIYLASQPLMSLYASGRQTGVVIESGDGVTQVVPIIEGVTSPNTFSKVDLAGIDITDYLASTLSCEDQIAREIKEKCCHVALDFDSELDGSEDQSFQLPDGQQITLGSERFCAPEVLFQPERILAIDRPGLHQVVHDAIQRFDSHVQEELYRSIVPVSRRYLCSIPNQSFSIVDATDPISLNSRLAVQPFSLASSTALERNYLILLPQQSRTLSPQRINTTRPGLEGVFLRRCLHFKIFGFPSGLMTKRGLLLCIRSVSNETVRVLSYV